jgi:MSHA type pilus biogenesis protein MshL
MNAKQEAESRPRRWRRVAWTLALGIALVVLGCKSSGPRPTSSPKESGAGYGKITSTNGWLAPTRGAAASRPPARLTSPIAPAPEPDPGRATNAPGAAAKSLDASLEQLRVTPPTEPQKLFSFSAKDLEVKDALALFARNNELNIVPDPDISGQITLDFRNLSLDKSMEAILDTFNYYAEIDGGLIRVRKTKTEFFNVDYVRLNRTGNGSTTANISSGSGSTTGGGVAVGAATMGGAGGGSGDSTSVSISKSDSIKFWDELEQQLTTLLSPNGKLTINRMVGNIMITDHKAVVDRAAKYLQHLKRTLHLQVDIEAQIYEVVFNDEFHFGIDWNNVMGSVEQWAISSGGLPVGIPSSRLIVDNPIGGLTPSPPALSLAITKDQTRVVIEALKEQGRLEVVSQPRLRTLNNQAALIKVGTDKPFFRQTSTTISTTGQPVTTENVEIQSITIGTVLALTPQISDDGWITMDISPVITRLVDTVSSGGDSPSTAPEVDIKQTSSLVRIRDNSTVVIGGLIQNERNKTERKVPVLGDIPILGTPFRGVFDNKRRTELVIFITPTIVR